MRTRNNRRWMAFLLTIIAATLTGCQTASFYFQAVRGQAQLLARRQSCEKLIADPKTPPDLKAKLQLAGKICDFAREELKLPVNGDYRCYADLGRPYAVWNVYDAPEFSMESKTWWYPIVGSLGYRGFFAERGARQYAAKLAGKGFDTYVEGVEAYSTLGWFKDPLLNTFIHQPEPVLVEILFHELAHQRLFASGDTDFNEAFATCVGQEGVRRWLRAENDPAALENYRGGLQRNSQFVQLVSEARKKLEALYGDERAEDGKIKAAKHSSVTASPQRHDAKQRILAELRHGYKNLKGNWGGYAGYEDWFARDLNNAQLNSIATYYDLVPAFERLLSTNDGDLEKFYAAVKQLAKLPKIERHHRLTSQ